MIFLLWMTCTAGMLLLLCPSVWTKVDLRQPRTRIALALMSGTVAFALLDGAAADSIGRLVSRIFDLVFVRNAPLWWALGFLLAFGLVAANAKETDSPVFNGLMNLIGVGIVAALGRGAMLPAGRFVGGLEREIMFACAVALGLAALILYAGRAAYRALGL